MSEKISKIKCESSHGYCECEINAFDDLKTSLFQYLIKEKGFRPEEIKFDVPIVVEVGDKRLFTKVDLLVLVDEKPAMCVRCREGSVVSRERGVIAAARLLCPDYVLPVCVQTNGEEFSIIDTISKKVFGKTREDLPLRQELKERLEKKLVKLPPKRRPVEEKILYFYEALG